MPPHREPPPRPTKPLHAVLAVLVLLVAGAAALTVPAGTTALAPTGTVVEEVRLNEPSELVRRRRRSTRARRQPNRSDRHDAPVAADRSTRRWPRSSASTCLPDAPRWSSPPRRGPPLLAISA